MKAKRLFLSLIGILTVFSLSAKTITGTVSSAEDGSNIPGVTIAIKGTTRGTITNCLGKYSIEASEEDILIYSFIGMKTQKILVGDQNVINVIMRTSRAEISEIIITGMSMERERKVFSPSNIQKISSAEMRSSTTFPRLKLLNRNKREASGYDSYYGEATMNTEGYTAINENRYKKAVKSPLSTFSIDVDAASYSNMRRFLNSGEKPPIDAVRIEEMINYFTYDYPQPTEDAPFSINNEVSECPWNKNNLLLHIGLQGKKVETENLPASNLVFLLDVSGSMSRYNKLPLVKKAFELLVEQLRKKDRVSVVVYAGSSGLVLPSTSGDRKKRILNSLESLHAGGSTAGGEGLKLAYKVAAENFIEGGNNRIIIATDGDFNVGQSSNAEMERLIEKERERGTFISVLGFGMGNYKDDKMEIIADKGNGNYAYIDNILEAKKVLVSEFGGTLFTIAKDVKIQVEFNPAVVDEYRLIGYENRQLENEDFDDDGKDAGEIGSGHSVTALYEIKTTKKGRKKEQDLRYQNTELNEKALSGDEIATVKFRYKKPDGDKSLLIEKVIPNDKLSYDGLSNSYKFSAVVAGFGMLLRNSKHKGDCSYEMLIDMAKEAKGEDENGYRSEFIRLMKLAKHL